MTDRILNGLFACYVAIGSLAHSAAVCIAKN
jgi:hypothetical protein